MNSRLIGLAAALVLCSASVARAQGAQKSIAGMYQLVTVDGHAIPFTPVHPDAPPNAGPGPEVLASTMIMRPDGSFVMAMSYRLPPGREPLFRAMPLTGRWTGEGGAYVGNWDGAGRTPLTLSGDTLTMNNEGMLFAYKKVR